MNKWAYQSNFMEHNISWWKSMAHIEFLGENSFLKLLNEVLWCLHTNESHPLSRTAFIKLAEIVLWTKRALKSFSYGIWKVSKEIASKTAFKNDFLPCLHENRHVGSTIPSSFCTFDDINSSRSYNITFQKKKKLSNKF